MPEWSLFDLHLLPVGIAVGLLASIVGVGGGFFIVPYLMLVYNPGKFRPVTAAATSLAIVLLTATSSTAGNARLKRIDYRIGLIFALGTIPGAVVGPHILPALHPTAFQIAFAALLVATAGYLLFFEPRPRAQGAEGGVPRRIEEADGTVHEYRIRFALGFMVSIVAGFVASMAGVGGGILHMPLLVLVFGVPPRIASASSQFILMITAAVGTVTYALQGRIDITALFFLGLGVATGAQIGVRLAKHVSGPWIKRSLAIVVLVVASQMVLRALGILDSR